MPRGREYLEVSYQSLDWHKLRAKHLKRNKWCAYCRDLRIQTLATTVDHRVPHRGDPDLFYDEGNLQSLCAVCANSVKQAEELQGGPIGATLDGWPRDLDDPVFTGKDLKPRETSQSLGRKLVERKKPG